VQRAISRHRQILDQRASMRVLQSRYELLTPREREVFPLVASGLLNKQVAAELNASEKTIKVHRGQLMQKMEAILCLTSSEWPNSGEFFPRGPS